MRRCSYRLEQPDAPAPRPGDLLVSSKSRYLIVTARLVKPRAPRLNGQRRFELGLERLRSEDADPPGAHFTLTWDRRGRPRRRGISR